MNEKRAETNLTVKERGRPRHKERGIVQSTAVKRCKNPNNGGYSKKTKAASLKILGWWKEGEKNYWTKGKVQCAPREQQEDEGRPTHSTGKYLEKPDAWSTASGHNNKNGTNSALIRFGTKNSPSGVYRNQRTKGEHHQTKKGDGKKR